MPRTSNAVGRRILLLACLMLAAVAASAAGEDNDARIEKLTEKLEDVKNEIDLAILMGRLRADELLALGRRICQKHPTAGDADMGWLWYAEFAVEFWARKAKPGTRGKTIAGVLLDPKAPADWRRRFLEHLDPGPGEDLLRLSTAEWTAVMKALEGVLAGKNRDIDARTDACDALVTRDANEYEKLLRKDRGLAKLFKKWESDPKLKYDPWVAASSREFTGKLGEEIASVRERIHVHVDLLMRMAGDKDEEPALVRAIVRELRSYHLMWLADSARIEGFYFDLYERRNDYPEEFKLQILSALYFALEGRVKREAYELANGSEDKSVRRRAASLLRSIYRPKPWEKTRRADSSDGVPAEGH